jgi:hypothetical protein
MKMMLVTGYWILDTGCWILDAGLKIPHRGRFAKRCKMLDGVGIPITCY